MPIGKNALKRVENNGYSKVNSGAPDMENSEVVEQVSPATTEEVAEKKPAAKKATAKKCVAKKSTKKAAPKAAAPKAEKIEKLGKDVEPSIAVGEKLPFYLL